MVATSPVPSPEIIHLSGISWQTYETLLEELSNRRLRLTYNKPKRTIIWNWSKSFVNGLEVKSRHRSSFRERYR